MRHVGPRVSSRCERHGLVVFNDGACLLCNAEQQSRRRHHFGALTLVSLAALGAFIMFLARSPANGRFRADVPNQAEDSTTHTTNRWLDFWGASARNTRTTTPVASASPSAASFDEVRAEDRALSAPVPAARSSILAPPAPPRAPVDPEPAQSENPADFDLQR